MKTSSKFTKQIVAAALSGALLLPAVSIAEAGPRDGWRHHHGGWGHHHPHKPHRYHGRRKKKDNTGSAVAAGIIGLAAGAIILGTMNQRSYAAPGHAYYPPARTPRHTHRHAPGYQPWSPAWYDYCRSKFRSFNPQTGTYTTYRGVQKFCQ